MDGRPARPQKAADDLHRVVLGVQFYRRVLADLLVSSPVPHLARDRDGGRVAGRRRLGDGAVADPLARVYEWRAPGLVGSRLTAVERLLLAAFRLVGLARYAVDRYRPGAGDRLCPLLRQGAGSLGRKPAPAKGPEP